MRRSLRVAVFALAIGVVVALTAGAAATSGPGGWDNIGNGPTPTASAFNGTVSVLAPGASGVLYAGGPFTDAGGDPGADHLAQWSGGAWKKVGSAPLSGAVTAIAYRSGKVYIGGQFTNAGGNPNADYLAVWDGRTWGSVCNAPGAPIGGGVTSLQIIGSTIYVGGTFQNAAGIAAADYLVACDLGTGAARSMVAKDGTIGTIYALTADSKGALYAGGRFGKIDGVPGADNVASFYGGAWHAMGTGAGGSAVDGFVRSLTSSGTNVYVGTDAVNIAGIPQADHVAKWNGSAWSAMGSNTAGGDGWFPTSAFINALTTSGSRVFAAGSFQNANGNRLADMVAEFDGKVWQPVGSNGAGEGPLNGNVLALTTFAKQLVAGGSFTNAGGDDLADFAATLPPCGHYAAATGRCGAAADGHADGDGARERQALHGRPDRV